jgi:hypothetical protein
MGLAKSGQELLPVRVLAKGLLALILPTGS